MDKLLEHAERLTEDCPELNALEVLHALSNLHAELDKHSESEEA